MNFIRSFISMLTVLCAKNRILWVFPTASKISPLRIIRFILATLNNEKTSIYMCESR